MSYHSSTNIRLPYQTTAVLFDLDDTLFDRGKAFLQWATSFAQAQFPSQESWFLQEVVDLLVSVDAHGYTPRQQLFLELQRAYPSLLHASIDALTEMFYQRFSHYVELDAQTALLLHSLHVASIPFGIVTNGSSHQQRKIEALGLDRYTSCIFISEVFGVKKPDATIFLAAAACLQVQAEHILFVGDNPLFDIWGAQQVGMRTVWFRRWIEWPATLASDCADMTISSFEELLTLLYQ